MDSTYNCNVYFLPGKRFTEGFRVNTEWALKLDWLDDPKIVLVHSALARVIHSHMGEQLHVLIELLTRYSSPDGFANSPDVCNNVQSR